MSSSSLIAQAQDLIEATTTKVAYVTPTNIEQVKIDLKGVLDTAILSNRALDALPLQGVTESQVRATVPSGILLVEAIARATSCLRNLSSPLAGTDDDIANLATAIVDEIHRGTEAAAVRVESADPAVREADGYSHGVRDRLLNEFFAALGIALPGKEKHISELHSRSIRRA